MTSIHKIKRANRIRRHARIRAKISGTAERPRIAVFKANQHVYVQAIDDVTSKTLAAVNDAQAAKKKGTKTEKAAATGKALAELLKKNGIANAVFDVGGFKYHGRDKAIAEGLRGGGTKI